MILEVKTRYFITYHDPVKFNRLRNLYSETDWYWLDFQRGPDGGRWFTAREARDAFKASDQSDKIYRIVKVTTTLETVQDLE